MGDLSAANQTAVISFLKTFLLVFMIRLGSWVKILTEWWFGGIGRARMLLGWGDIGYKSRRDNFHTQTYIFLEIINF